MPSILIVDDDTPLLYTLAYAFRMRSFRVFLAGDGESALEIAQSTPIDAALVDISMEGMDGFTLCQTIRRAAEQRGQTMHVWIMTGGYWGDAVARAKQAGAVKVLEKPFELQQLFREIESELGD